jgi:hypothetical protein
MHRVGRAAESEYGGVSMPRVILLSSLLALLVLVAGADLALKITKPAAAQHHAASAAPTELTDPARLTRQLRKLREDGALP